MARYQRPDRTYTTDAFTRAVRVLSLVAVVVIAGWLLVLYPSMPQVMPTHFDATGTADAWGDKSSVLWLAAMFVVLVALVAWLSTKPRLLNLPVHLTEQNAQQVYREGERMMVWLLPPMVLLFVGIALSQLGVQGAVLLWVGVAAMPVVIVLGLVRLLRAV